VGGSATLNSWCLLLPQRFAILAAQSLMLYFYAQAAAVKAI
jgi:hypothetical protein